ncbi:patatin-like phospholipase family protein [Flexithrix dorotheae]|uniref:patatin-like phospholipase family protein n=1 Tax=Flexithrix dorotheae TaxID=70993 RepID=UPI0003733B98|nr:patatin-like phospholipase family protein [Flexithrix dorotheae]
MINLLDRLPSFIKSRLNKSRSIALVLSSGGARGLAHIGVIEELLRNNYQITSIAGTSMGAVIGGIYAAGKLQEFKEWASSVDKVKLLRLVDFTFSSQGFIRGDRVLNEIKKMVGHIHIEDLDIPYVTVATDIKEQEEVIFRKGDLYEAIRSSMAIPTVFTPNIVDGKELVDGGILNPLPMDLVHRTPGDLLVVVNVNHNGPLPKPIMKKIVKNERNGWFGSNGNGKAKDKKMGYFDLLMRSFDLTQDKLSDLIIEKHQPDILINISRESSGSFEFYRTKELIEIGKEAFANRIIKKH